MEPDSRDPDSPRPASLWLLLVLAAVFVWIGVDPAVRREDPELALPAFALAAFLVALFFFPDLRQLVSRIWRH